MTPYIPDGWRCMLHDLNIAHLFPLLVNDITYGSPIGNLPPLRHTFIPANLSSALNLPHIIDNKITVKLSAGRMSGPFSLDQASTIFEGHFCTSPLGLVEKTPGSGKWLTICHLSKEDADGKSTNGWLNSSDFPTKYYSASMMADFVRTDPTLTSDALLTWPLIA